MNASRRPRLFYHLKSGNDTTRQGLVLVVLLTAWISSIGVLSAHADFYVSPTGSDANPGSRGRPFATLERARDAVRSETTRRSGKRVPITVWLRGGDYSRTNALELGAADSGTAEAPVTWRAYKQEQVRLLGGRSLEGFVPVTEMPYAAT